MAPDDRWDRAHFEDEFEEADPWSFASSAYEQRKYERQVRAVADHADGLECILELGCAEGVHSAMWLDAFPDAELVGVDISETAVERARERVGDDRARFVAGDALDAVGELEGPFDLVVWSETIYYLGDRVPLTALAAFVEAVFDLLADGGLLCSANVHREPDDPESGLTAEPLMRAYFELLAWHGEVVHRERYVERKEERGREYAYEVWVFRGAEAEY